MKKVIVFFFISLLTYSFPQEIWEPTNGPFGGKITHVLTVDDSLLFTGTQKGSIYKSVNSVEDWKLVHQGNFDFIFTDLHGRVYFKKNFC